MDNYIEYLEGQIQEYKLRVDRLEQRLLKANKALVKKAQNKPKKRANGTGSVVTLPSGRFRAQITIGFNEKGQPVCKYKMFDDKDKAFSWLDDVLGNKYIIDPDIKTKDLYEMWWEQKGSKLPVNTGLALRKIKYLESISNKSYRDLTTIEMQACIDNCGAGYSTQSHIKTLFKHLDGFAYDAGIIIRMNSIRTNSAAIETKPKTIFSSKEIAKLWKNKDMPFVDMALFMLYTGYRKSEVQNLTIENVNLKDGVLIGGTKTKNGRDKIMPIHPKIRYIVEKYYNTDLTYLFEVNGKPLTDERFYKLWNRVMGKLGMKHISHEARHTFSSALDRTGANEVCKDRLMGHTSIGTRKQTYTHKSIEELRETIEKIDY